MLRSAGGWGAAGGRVSNRLLWGGVLSRAGYIEGSHMATRSAAALKGECIKLCCTSLPLAFTAQGPRRQAPPAHQPQQLQRRASLAPRS